MTRASKQINKLMDFEFHYAESFNTTPQPYTAGVIGIIWLGSAAMLAIESGLPLVRVVIINMLVSVVVAAFGFRGKSES